MSSRQAALLMHALAADDKAWVLEQLEPDEQKQLQLLLSELGALGIPEDPAMIDIALARNAPTPAAAPTDDDSYLSGVAATDIARALRPESTAFVRKLLACKDWPWRLEVAAELAVPASRAFDAVQAADATAFRQCAIRLLAERLRQSGAPATAIRTVEGEAHGRHRGSTWQQRIQALWRQPA